MQWTSGGRPVFQAILALVLAGACTPRAEPRVETIRSGRPGPTVALVAGVHGGKRSAVRALEQLGVGLRRDLLRGTVLLVPTAHAAAAGSGLAQLSPVDSLNLNRVFPGRADGRPTEQLAHAIMRDIVAHSDYLIDLHGSDGEEMVGAFAYVARPGLDPRLDSAALQLAVDWGAPRIVWDSAGPRTLAAARFLQTAAHLSGVPAITVFEAGRQSEDSAAVAAFVRGARHLLARRGMRAAARADHPGPVLHGRREVITAPEAGTWSPALTPDASVRAGELLGTLTSSSGAAQPVHAANDGVVLHIRSAGRTSAGVPLAITAVTP